MNRKTIFGYDYTNNTTIKFLCYLFVGGSAALLEWILFYFFTYSLALAYLSSTTLAFSLSTIYHYFASIVLVFDSQTKYSRNKELFLVIIVSIIGLILNLIFMSILVSCLNLTAMYSKIITSFIVFVWNYVLRKKYIF